MRLGSIDVPCGCENRKYIMFQAGRMGLTEGAILAAAIVAVAAAWRYNR